jgi:hypothetical protein
MNFPTTIERHDLNPGPTTCPPTPTSPRYVFDNIRLGAGRTILAMVTGRDLEHDELGGYPALTIAEANAFADELIRRWNAHEALVARVAELESTQSTHQPDVSKNAR